MEKLRFKKRDGKFVVPCPYGKRDENTQTLYNVGSLGCKCDCEHFEGIRISEGVVYCLGKPGLGTYIPIMTHKNLLGKRFKSINVNQE